MRPEHARAVDGHHRALGLARESSHRYPEAAALIGLAAVHQQLDHPDQALNYANQALTLARHAGYCILEGQALTALAGLYLDQLQTDQAAEHARRALDLHRDTGYRLGEARTLMVLGHVRRQAGGEEAAIPYWRQAMAIFAQIGTEGDQVRALHPVAAGWRRALRQASPSLTLRGVAAEWGHQRPKYRTPRLRICRETQGGALPQGERSSITPEAVQRDTQAVHLSRLASDPGRNIGHAQAVAAYLLRERRNWGAVDGGEGR